MEWKSIDGYRFPYRVNDQGVVQRQLENGKWMTLRPKTNDGGTARVRLRKKDNSVHDIYLARLVWSMFKGPIPPRKVVGIRNGLKMDCAIENLFLTTRKERGHTTRSGNCRPVMKIDRAGNVVAFYRSAAEAARANYVSESSMRAHCGRKTKDIYSLDGYEYRYENRGVGQPKKERAVTK